MKIITVTMLVSLFVLLIIGLNGSKDCMYDLCLCVGLLRLTYTVNWLLSYIYCKKKAEALNADIENLFLIQEELIERLKMLSEKRQHE